MNAPVPLQELRQLNADERAAIAAYFAREGYPGLMFITRDNGDVVPMVVERVQNKPENTEE